MKRFAIILSATLVVACSKGEGDDEETAGSGASGGAANPELKKEDYLNEAKAPGLAEDIAKARSEIQEKPLEELTLPFSVCPTDADLKDYRELGNGATKEIADEAEAFCTFEGPALLAERHADALVEKHEDDPEGMFPSDCTSLQRNIEKITDVQDEARVQALKDTFSEHCSFLE